jgi:hypothetical protein
MTIRDRANIECGDFSCSRQVPRPLLRRIRISGTDYYSLPMMLRERAAWQRFEWNPSKIGSHADSHRNFLDSRLFGQSRSLIAGQNGALRNTVNRRLERKCSLPNVIPIGSWGPGKHRADRCKSIRQPEDTEAASNKRGVTTSKKNSV